MLCGDLDRWGRVGGPIRRSNKKHIAGEEF